MNRLLLNGPRKIETAVGPLVLPFERNLVSGASPSQELRIPAIVMIEGQALHVELGAAVTRGVVAQPCTFDVVDATTMRASPEANAAKLQHRLANRQDDAAFPQRTTETPLGAHRKDPK